MFIITAKLTKKKLVGAICAAGVILIAVITLMGGRAAASASAARGIAVKNIQTAEDRTAYLVGLGWDVSPEPIESQEVLIPAQWDTVLNRYNELQLRQGMDLAKYKNKRVMRYVYELHNHPSGEKDVYVCILIHKKTVIAGDIQSHAQNGFMHGLERSSWEG